MTLKIAVWYHLPSGGAKRALYYQVKGLLDKGHHVEAWCPPTEQRDFLPLKDLVVEHELPLGSTTVGGVRGALYRGAGADVEALGKIAAMRVHAQHFAKALASKSFDVLFASSCQWLSVPPVAHGTSLPSVLYLQEPYRRLYEAQPTLPWIAEQSGTKRGLRGWQARIGSVLRLEPLRQQSRFELENVRAFDRVLVNSRFSRESAYRAYGLDTRLCRLGIDTELFANHEGDRRPVVLSVGQFAPPKNPEFIIRAIAASQTKPHLVWIGNAAKPRYLGEMKRLAADLGVSWDLKVLVSDKELVEHYQEGLAMLYAPRLEPLGLGPLEANACGMPVIGLAEGGVRETIIPGENGILVDSHIEMAAAIDRFMREPHEARSLGQRAARHVRQYWTLEAASLELEAHLRDTVQQPRAASSSK